ncbi:MAG: hypothetical protein J6R88_00135 [Clostridia bacterium]|nr:hypothetical protein [Clostridia bacterium]
MKVKDILILCCDLLEDNNLKTYFTGGTPADSESAKADGELLLKCYNLITDEISREYYRLTTEETFTPTNGVVSLSQFMFNPVVINTVTSLDGGEVDYKVNPVKVYVDKTVRIGYAYACPERMIEEMSDFSFTKISKRVLAYGTITEYMLIKGMYEEAVTWRDKYRTSLYACLSVKKVKRIKKREWF